MKKQNYLIISILIFSIFCLTSLFANEIKTTDGIQTNSSKDQFGIENTVYTFTKPADALNIGNRIYWNIQPASNTSNSFITLDSNGTIKEANFKVNEKGGSYVFGDRIYEVPPESEVQFKDGTLRIFSPENAEIKLPKKTSDKNSNANVRKTIFEGKNLKFPKDSILNNGQIEYRDGNFYVGNKLPGASMDAVINGIGILKSTENSEDDIQIFFGGSGALPGIHFNEDQMVFNQQNIDYTKRGKNGVYPIVSLYQGNPYLKGNNLPSISAQDNFYFKLAPGQLSSNLSLPSIEVAGSGMIYFSQSQQMLSIEDGARIYKLDLLKKDKNERGYESRFTRNLPDSYDPKVENAKFVISTQYGETIYVDESVNMVGNNLKVNAKDSKSKNSNRINPLNPMNRFNPMARPFSVFK